MTQRQLSSDSTGQTELIARLARCYTGVVHDTMREMGLADFTLPAELRPLLPEHVLCGPAFTIAGQRDTTIDAHESLLAWTGLLSKAKPDHVWVCQPNDHTIAHMGELSAETLQRKGVRGCVIDGGIRDANFMIDLGFNCWHRYKTPRDIVGLWHPTAIDKPITIGDVEIHPGDLMLGDRDGMIRVPLGQAADIAHKAGEAMLAEDKVRAAILEGVDPQEAYLRYGKF